MISDETFPSDLLSDTEDFDPEKQVISTVQFNGGSSSHSSNNTSEDDLNSSTEIEECGMENSMETQHLISNNSLKLDDTEVSQQQHQQESFECASSRNNNILPPPRAPIKKKKSFSCHNLNNVMKRTGGHNYDHVESKVKKLIENLTEDRRKTLLRHKSMPVCSQQASTIDEKVPDSAEKDLGDIKRELRRKSIKIYELEETIELKDNQIYELEREKSRMKMVFDKLRVEMQQLKDIEREYKHFKARCSPNREHRDAFIQTEDSGIDSMEYSKVNILRESIILHHNDTNRVPQNPVIRQLAFENSNINQSHFSDINNTSSDNLLPEEAELHHMDSVQVQPQDNGGNHPEVVDSTKAKKKKKRLRFFSFVPCVSRK